jgi:hypothetical protein
MRYGMQCVDAGKSQACIQDSDQVPEEVKVLLEVEHVEHVVLLKNIDGRKCVQAWNKIHATSPVDHFPNGDSYLRGT